MMGAADLVSAGGCEAGAAALRAGQAQSDPENGRGEVPKSYGFSRCREKPSVSACGAGRSETPKANRNPHTLSTENPRIGKTV
jgi:hypothetical protein